MRYYVRLVRPRFETRLVEVEAGTQSEAEWLAEVQTIQTKGRWRPIKYDDNVYGCHAEQCLSTDDLEANGLSVKEAIAELSSLAPSKNDKYLLLHADTSDGDGKLLFQPWLIEEHPVTISDLTEDWTAQLEQLLEGALEQWQELRKSDHIAQIIPLRRGTQAGDPPEDDDGSPAA